MRVSRGDSCAILWGEKTARASLCVFLTLHSVRHAVDNSRSVRLLGARYRSADDTLRDSFRCLLDAGLVQRKLSKFWLILWCIVTIIVACVWFLW